MFQIVRATKNDYQEYRTAYENITFSVGINGECISPYTNSNQVASVDQKTFQKYFYDHRIGIFFLKDDNIIKGIAELTYWGRSCHIAVLAVFEHGKGLGTLFYQGIEDNLISHGYKRVFLFCPFDGARQFWLKQGYSQIDKKGNYMKLLKKKRRNS